MTAESLFNRIGRLTTQTVEQQPVVQTKDLDRRLHQYRSKLLAATNKQPAVRSDQESSKQKSESSTTSRLASTSTSKAADVDRTENRYHRIESKLERPSYEKSAPVYEVNESYEVDEISPAVASTNINTKNANSDDLQVEQTSLIQNTEIEALFDETIEVNDLEVNLIDQSDSVSILTSFHPSSLLPQVVESTTTVEQPETTPTALTRLFSRFDQLSFNTTQTASQGREQTQADSELNVIPAIPSGLAKLFHNPNSATPESLIPADVQPENILGTDIDSAVNLPSTLTGSLSPIIEDIESSLEQDETTYQQSTTLVPPAELFNTIIEPVTTYDQPISLQQESQPSAIQQGQININSIPQPEVPLEDIQFKQVNITSESTVVETEFEESTPNQPVLKQLSSADTQLPPIVETTVATELTVEADQPDAPTEIEPAFYTAGTSESKGTIAPQQFSAPSQSHQVRDIIDQVEQAFSQTSDGPQTMRIRLNPPELGMLQIDIMRTEAGIVARVQAETPQAQQLIKEGLQQLKDSLALQGQFVQSIQVDLTPDLSEDRDPTERQPQQEQQQSRRDEPEDQAQQSPKEKNSRTEFRKDYITEMDMEI